VHAYPEECRVEILRDYEERSSTICSSKKMCLPHACGRKNLYKEYDSMIRVNIFYPNKEGGRFDLDYYLNTHMPMAIEKLGPSLKGVSVEHGVSGVQPGTKPAYVAMCNYTFDSAEAFLHAPLPITSGGYAKLHGYRTSYAV
jgi:uncharacterized protein (TIGR02118 family)